jgi:hypothetical protein
MRHFVVVIFLGHIETQLYMLLLGTLRDNQFIAILHLGTLNGIVSSYPGTLRGNSSFHSWVHERQSVVILLR